MLTQLQNCKAIWQLPVKKISSQRTKIRSNNTKITVAQRKLSEQEVLLNEAITEKNRVMEFLTVTTAYMNSLESSLNRAVNDLNYFRAKIREDMENARREVELILSRGHAKLESDLANLENLISDTDEQIDRLSAMIQSQSEIYKSELEGQRVKCKAGVLERVELALSGIKQLKHSMRKQKKRFQTIKSRLSANTTKYT